MATTDIRLERVKQEYVGLRDAQDALMDRIDTYEAALLGLTESVASNHDLIMANRDLIIANRETIMENRDLIMENRDLIMENRDLIMANRELIMANRELIMANHEWTQRQFADLHEKIDRLMTHLDVPPKPPAGFVKE